MMKTALMITAIVFICGCSTHQPDPNAVMMDKVIGELDRETAK